MRRRRHQTHHKHSSIKKASEAVASRRRDRRRLLDRLAAHEAVRGVATGRVKPRMGAGRPVAPISKIREIESGLSITINTDGASVSPGGSPPASPRDACVVTSDPAAVAARLRDEGLAR